MQTNICQNAENISEKMHRKNAENISEKMRRKNEKKYL